MSERTQGTLVRWLGVAIAGIVMVAVFVLAGGVGSNSNTVALAGNVHATTASSPHIVGISLNACAGTELNGSVAVADKFTGNLTLGLFALEPSPQHLTRQFVDTSERAKAAFSHALLAPFSFTIPPVKAPAYEVVVLPSTGKITNTTTLVESQAVPLCNTQTVTTTNTATQTVTATSTGTTTTNATTTVPVNATVTVTSSARSTSITTFFNTVFTTITASTTTTVITTVTTSISAV